MSNWKNNLIKKIRRYAKRWIMHTGLNYGHIDLVYKDHFFSQDEAENSPCFAYCSTSWKYQESSISFSLEAMKDCPDKQIEAIVVHELMHIFLNEMRAGGVEHEERVATCLQKAFVWARDAAKEGSL